MPTHQQDCDDIFRRFAAGDIGRQAYVDEINALGVKPTRDLRKRMDGRTLGRFALHVYDTTVRERFLLNAWTTLFEEDVEVEDLGLANDGRLVLSAGPDSRRADYVLRAGGVETKLEVKFGPTQNFATFKIADLSNYAAQGDVTVLTVLGDTEMMGPNGDPRRDTPLSIPKSLSWFLFDADGIDSMLRHGEQGRHRGFGGKETVRIYARDFGTVFGGLLPWREQEWPLACAADW